MPSRCSKLGRGRSVSRPCSSRASDAASPPGGSDASRPSASALPASSYGPPAGSPADAAPSPPSPATEPSLPLWPQTGTHTHLYILDWAFLCFLFRVTTNKKRSCQTLLLFFFCLWWNILYTALIIGTSSNQWLKGIFNLLEGKCLHLISPLKSILKVVHTETHQSEPHLVFPIHPVNLKTCNGLN